jgi:lysine 2-monooxygenase
MPGVRRVARGAALEPVDVVVAGAGVSGLYAAWSLRTRDPGPRALFGGPRPPSVAVFDMAQRVGGRLLSVAPPLAPHLRAELGGMRFLPTQRLVAGLIEQLGLDTRPLQLADEHSLVYLRGETHRIPELADPQVRLPYDLAPAERGRTPTQLLASAIFAHVPEALELDRRDWATIKRTREALGRPLSDLSLLDLMRDGLSSEAIELATFGSGYETFLRAYNAGDMLQTLVSLASQDFHTPLGGYDALPRALAQRYAKAGGELHLEHRLLTVEQGERDGERVLRCMLDHRGDLVAIEARAVVLALPAAALPALDQTGFLFDSREVRADLTAVAPVPASKLFLAFDEPWWRRLGSSVGHLATDLPLRQVMYFGIEGDTEGGTEGDGHALLMASYNQSLSTWYWADAFDPAEGAFPAQGHVPAGLEAPRAMVAAAQRQLTEAYGFDIPDPYWAVYKDWAVEPYNGGWSQWRLGARSYEVMPRVRKPVADAHVYVCGDAFSDLPGWVEGALSTTERVLQDHLGLTFPADRLPPGWDLGV